MKLSQLSNQLNGFRKSFEYISDYVGVASGLGLSVWNHEMSR